MPCVQSSTHIGTAVASFQREFQVSSITRTPTHTHTHVYTYTYTHTLPRTMSCICTRRLKRMFNNPELAELFHYPEKEDRPTKEGDALDASECTVTQ